MDWSRTLAAFYKPLKHSYSSHNQGWWWNSKVWCYLIVMTVGAHEWWSMFLLREWEINPRGKKIWDPVGIHANPNQLNTSHMLLPLSHLTPHRGAEGELHCIEASAKFQFFFHGHISHSLNKQIHHLSWAPTVVKCAYVLGYACFFCAIHTISSTWYVS